VHGNAQLWLIKALYFCLSLSLAAQTVQQLESTARERLAAKDANGALAAYQKLAALVPKSAEYEDQIGFLLAATNRSSEAIPHFQRATELDPKMAQAWYHLGVALALTKQTAPAVNALQQAVSLAPGHADYRDRLALAWATLGDAHQQQHRYKEARDAYRQSLKLNPNNDLARNSFGNALVRSGDPAAGLKEFRRILAHDPKNLQVQVNVGFAYIAAGDFKAAIQHLSNYPNDAGAHYDLGIAYKQTDDLPRATAEFERAVALDPSLAEAHYSLALTYIDAGDPDKAISQLRAAVAQRPDYNEAWYMLGNTLKDQGDVKGAIAALRKSVAIDGLNAAAWNNLGLLLRKDGDRAGSAEAFAKAAQIRQAEDLEKQKKLKQGPGN
jgi:tetratricopeptide (TPR) repeat protein